MTDLATRYAVVVPTVGRPSLAVLLDGLAAQQGPLPEEVVVVDDRPDPSTPLLERSSWPFPLRVVRGWGRGPAAARNLGWRLDEDRVGGVPRRRRRPAGGAGRAALAVDLGAAPARRRRVPGPHPGAAARHRRPTDWERSTAGLESARWATADMAYRRCALLAVDGFDERFPRAYREDADLALRVVRAGHAPRRRSARGRPPRPPRRPGHQRAGAARQRRRRADAPPARAGLA